MARPGAVAAALFLLAAVLAPAAEADLVALKAGRIQTVTLGVIDHGVILIRGDRIIEIGAGLVIPPGAKVLDFADGFIMPGVVSPDSNLGLGGQSPFGPDEASRFPSVQGKNLADHHVLYSIDPGHPDYALALKNGFTTLAISPPAAGISGLGSLVRPGPPRLREMILERDAFLKISVLVNSPFRRMLKSALEAAGKPPAAAKEQGWQSAVEETFRRVVEGLTPLIADCPGPDSVAYLLEAVAPYPRIRLAVRGGPETYKAGAALKAKAIPLILEPGIEEKESPFSPYPERTNYVLKCLGLGLEVAFQASGTAREQIRLFHSLNRLLELGVDKEALVRGVTIAPAKILGIEGLVGSLEKGKKADLIVFRSDPLEGDPVIEAVLAGGREVR